MEKAVPCYKADRLVASLPGFRCVQPSLAVLYANFELQGKNAANEATDGCPLMPDVVLHKERIEIACGTSKWNL